MSDPTLADWLQGWGTVVGSVFSAIAAIAALGLYWREVASHRLDLEDLTTRQARGVLATIEVPSRPTRIESMDLVVHNFTNEVILSLYLKLHRRDLGSEVTWMSADVVPPGQAWTRHLSLDPVMICDRPEHPPELFEFNLWFTDANGRHWHRRDRGQPERTTSEPAREWASFQLRDRR